MGVALLLLLGSLVLCGIAPAGGITLGLEHFESCEQCIAAGLVRTAPPRLRAIQSNTALIIAPSIVLSPCVLQGWSPNGCRCGGFANTDCSGTASDCHAASAGPALAFYAGRFPKAFPPSLVKSKTSVGPLQLAGSISCGETRSGDTSDFASGGKLTRNPPLPVLSWSIV